MDVYVLLFYKEVIRIIIIFSSLHFIQYGPYKLGNLKEGKIEEIKVIKDA